MASQSSVFFLTFALAPATRHISHSPSSLFRPRAPSAFSTGPSSEHVQNPKLHPWASSTALFSIASRPEASLAFSSMTTSFMPEERRFAR